MDIKKLADEISRMMEFDVYIDPLLVFTYSELDMEPAMRAARELSDALYSRYVTIDVFTELSEVPYSDTLMHWALSETILSTAIWLSRRNLDVTMPDEAMVIKAHAQVSAYITQIGITRMYWAYYCIIGHDMLQPLRFVKEMPESDLLLGRRHHPFPRGHVELCFLICLYRRLMKFRQSHSERRVALTRHGVNIYDWIHESLRGCGYLERRISMSYMYQFDRVEDWDDMCEIVWPGVMENRRKFIDWIGVEQDSHVLEIACGTGTLTFDAGLYEAVGPRGMLTAIDHSISRLDQARSKMEAFGMPPQVILKHALARNLPFSDNLFEVVCGTFFLHFADPVQTVREMARVTREGAVVSVYQWLDTSLDKPFFREWFEPIFALVRPRSTNRFDTYLPTEKQVVGWFAEAGLDAIESKGMPSEWVFDDPEIVVQHLVRGISFFEQALAELPWDDRKTLIAELIDRGRDVRRKYPLAERIIQMPGVAVKGVKRRR